METVALLLLGATLTIASIWVGFVIATFRIAWAIRDINDAPCLVCNRQQCECGE